MDSDKKIKRKPNPRDSANPLSVITFSWTIPTFIKGYKTTLKEDDLFEPLRRLRSHKLGARLQKAWDEEVKGSKNPTLSWALFRCFGKELLYLGVLMLIFDVVPTIIQPLALGQLISYYEPNQTEITTEWAYIWATVVVACPMIASFAFHVGQIAIGEIAMKMRIASCTLVYRKALRMSQAALRETTVGQLVNVLSNDVIRFDIGVSFFNNMWIGPVETIAITYLMWQQIGVATVPGVVFMLLFIPFQLWLGKKSSTLRKRTALKTDKRVRLMNEIITGIQVIKLYNWEKPFSNLVATSRKKEIKEIRYKSYVHAVIISFSMFVPRVSIFFNILTYFLLGNYINSVQLFVVISFFNILRLAMTMYFPQGCAEIAELGVTVQRLTDILRFEENDLAGGKDLGSDPDISCVSCGNCDDVNGCGDGKTTKATTLSSSSSSAISIAQATAKWLPDISDDTLCDVNMEFPSEQLTAVIGHVGSSKSSLYQAILKELQLSSGTIKVNGTVSYAAQEPWIFSGTIRQNILFGQRGHVLNKAKYKKVVEACALTRDFSLFPNGDETFVGDRGVTLSGGQKARINLARAVYKDADIYLLDDPLSAVDTHVAKHIFDHCINGYLSSKTRVLITHQLQFLKDVENVYVMKNGRAENRRKFTDLHSKEIEEIAYFDEDDQSKAKKQQENGCGVNGLCPNNCKLVLEGFGKSTEKKLEEVPRPTAMQSFMAYIRCGGNCLVLLLIVSLFLLAQFLGSMSDYAIRYWVDLENNSTTKLQLVSNNSLRLADSVEADGILWGISGEMFIYIYSGIIVVLIILTLARSFSFFAFCMQSSINLHNKMFTAMVKTAMKFFDTNQSGNILNRFSKDIGSIDERIPAILMNCLEIGLLFLSVTVVVAVVSPWLLVPTVLLGFLFSPLRAVYLATSRNVKHLEASTRSPVFSHLSASLQGLTTIRAFKAEKALEKEFDSHQDLNSSAYYMFLASSRAFSFWLDMICVIYIGVVTYSFLILKNDDFGGNVGLAITQAIGLMGVFQWGIRQWADLENQMVSVERVQEYANLQSEENGAATLAKPWPTTGDMSFKNLCLRYSFSTSEPCVLKNLTFDVQANEKIGIVGRTGAGKSSLLSALFQLTKTEGSIVIDGVDTQHIPLDTLRSKISIIPQEPVLFSGTVRYNLDPFDEYSDEVLWKAVEEVQLKPAIEELPAGLSSKMAEGGSNFSVGQRQLFCLARALIRNNKILVLDEATANVDQETDSLIQNTIKRKFKDCTVLTIAHRLNTVMDSDKVLVMDAGKAVEFDEPYLLLQNKDGVLYEMVQKTGQAMAEHLTKVAKEVYSERTIRKRFN